MPSVEDSDSVTNPQEFRQVGTGHHHRLALRCSSIDLAIDVHLAADINAPGWFIEEQYLRVVVHETPKGHFLLIAARELLDRLGMTVGADVQGAHPRLGFPVLRGRMPETPTHQIAGPGDEQVFRNAAGQKQSVLLAILAQKAQSSGPTLAGSLGGNIQIAQANRPGANGVQAKGRTQGLGATRTHQPKQPEDLSPPQTEGHPAGFLDALQRRNPKHVLTQRPRTSGIEVLNFAAHHDPNEFRIGDVRQRPGGHTGPVAQDRVARANSAGFLQEVGDIQQADPLFPQAIQHSEEVLGVSPGQAGSRLIEDEHPRLRPQRPGDLDELLLGDGQLPGDRVQ